MMEVNDDKLDEYMAEFEALMAGEPEVDAELERMIDEELANL